MNSFFLSSIFVICNVMTVLAAVDPSFTVTYTHVKDREGFKTIGYVPTADSGVTIGIGIDLGQQTKAGLVAKGVPSTVINKCAKYLGYKTQAALDKAGLKASNLVLTTTEADQLSQPFIKDSYDIAKPYAVKMNATGLAVLTSLRHWAGSLGCSSCKLSVTVTVSGKAKDVNYVWNAIKGKTATNAQLKAALLSTYPKKKPGTATYNRLRYEYLYL